MKVRELKAIVDWAGAHSYAPPLFAQGHEDGKADEGDDSQGQVHSSVVEGIDLARLGLSLGLPQVNAGIQDADHNACLGGVGAYLPQVEG